MHIPICTDSTLRTLVECISRARSYDHSLIHYTTRPPNLSALLHIRVVEDVFALPLPVVCCDIQPQVLRLHGTHETQQRNAIVTLTIRMAIPDAQQTIW